MLDLLLMFVADIFLLFSKILSEQCTTCMLKTLRPSPVNQLLFLALSSHSFRCLRIASLSQFNKSSADMASPLSTTPKTRHLFTFWLISIVHRLNSCSRLGGYPWQLHSVVCWTHLQPLSVYTLTHQLRCLWAVIYFPLCGTTFFYASFISAIRGGHLHHVDLYHIDLYQILIHHIQLYTTFMFPACINIQYRIHRFTLDSCETLHSWSSEIPGLTSTIGTGSTASS